MLDKKNWRVEIISTVGQDVFYLIFTDLVPLFKFQSFENLASSELLTSFPVVLSWKFRIAESPETHLNPMVNCSLTLLNYKLDRHWEFTKMAFQFFKYFWRSTPFKSCRVKSWKSFTSDSEHKKMDNIKRLLLFIRDIKCHVKMDNN